jgi:hypothetical protein
LAWQQSFIMKKVKRSYWRTFCLFSLDDSNYEVFYDVFDTATNQYVNGTLVEQELPTLLEHFGSPLVVSGVRVTQSLVLCVCFVDHCLSFCTFSFGHCVVCFTDSDYLPWYPQTPVDITKINNKVPLDSHQDPCKSNWIV